MIEGLREIGVHWPSLVVYSVNFAILTTVLYFLAFRPMLAGIRQRVEERQEAEDLLTTSRMEVASQHAAAMAELEAARNEARAIVDRAMVHAREESRGAIERGLEQARTRSADDLHAEREKIHAAGAALAVAAAGRVIRESLGPGTQHALVQSALAEIASAEVIVGDSGREIVSVTSAVALSADEWAAVGGALQVLLGDHAMAIHHVRPAVLGGLAVEIGDTVIDATVLGKLHQLRDEMVEGEVDRRD
jgi:F-type H+-transporting ATPase subunit b